MTKCISIVTPCYNEQDNVQELYERVRAAMASVGRYHYEHIFIDNSSTDRTVPVLKRIASQDTNVKIIVNARNFGPVRSPMHAIHQARGDALIGMAADLQDPPEMIPEMIRRWEEGTPVVIAVKRSSEENPLMFWVRKRYYRLVNRLSNTETYENFTGFGLYDRKVIDFIKSLSDPYPYFRGLIAEIGFPRAELLYDQPRRKRGITKNSLYALYDTAMLGITNFSKVPLRMMVLFGFACAAVCVLVSFAYFIYKLLFWNNFSVGIAPLVIGIFFFASVQMMFMGILGEYIGSIHTFVQKRPFVFELERVNFEYDPGEPQPAPQVAGAMPSGKGMTV